MRPAKLVADRYALEEVLGRGGMGVVWRAQDQLLGRRVALKEIEPPPGLGDQERNSMRARVLREARAAARLTHPGAIVVYDVVEVEDTTYIAMELVEAATLADRVGRHGPLSDEEAAEIGANLLETLEAAHSAGIVHRDVKPSNVMLTANGTVKLADFGIASVTGDPQLTSSGVILGSPAYMAPEQARGEQAGPAADLWGVGVTLYFATQGHPPFEGEQPLAVLNSILHDDPLPFARPGRLSSIIESLLSKQPDARPATAHVRAALQDLQATEGATRRLAHLAEATQRFTTPPPPAGRVPEPVPAPSRKSQGPTATASASRERVWLYALAAVALLLVAAAFVIPRMGGDDEPRPRSAEGAANNSDRGSGGAAAEAERNESADPETAPEMTAYEIGDTGYSVGYPEEWAVVDDPLGDASSARFQDDQGRYLLVDWTDQPGTDAVAAWERSSAGFAERHDAYEEIRIEPTTFLDFDTAAIWEYAYSDGGVRLHAINLGMADGDWGLALNFQTHQEDWQASLPLFDAIQDSFASNE